MQQKPTEGPKEKKNFERYEIATYLQTYDR